jgi:putative hydrolase of the HAD superfamily
VTENFDRLEHVFLDAGGVLVFPNWTRVSVGLARHGVEIPAARLAAVEPRAKQRLDLGATVQSTNDHQRGWLYFNLVLLEAGVPPSEATDAALAELHIYHAQRNLWESVPEDVPQALDKLRSLGLRLAVVSNANGTLRSVFDRLGLSGHVDILFDSHIEGVEKPDPRFFQIALERTGAHKETTVHVGDLYNVDVLGARAAGIQGVLLDTADLYRGYDCRRVRTLGELARSLAEGRR